MNKKTCSKILKDKGVETSNIDSIWNLLLSYENIYRNKVIFSILNDLDNDVEVDSIIEKLRVKGYYWGNSIYKGIKDVIEEQDNFLINPFEVEEGVLECNKCGSKRVFSYSKQVRSSDEGTSVFATCVACKSSWVHSG